MAVVPICNESLKPADGNALALYSSDAFGLALALLRAYSAAYCRQRGRLCYDLICILKITLFDVGTEIRNIDLNGTAVDARLIFAV